jgi:hypothetical protein
MVRWLGWVLLLSGCIYNPSVGDGVQKCSSGSPSCPDGYYCAPDAHCWKKGHPFVARGDGGAPDLASDLAVTLPNSCSDGVKDNSETDVDCGGGVCPGCATGKVCMLGADCASGICNAMKMSCVASTCDDGIKDGSETDVDCGGSCPTKCRASQSCAVDADCAPPSTCDPTHHCSAAQCMNGIKDVDNPSANPPTFAETDVDCGGMVCAPCALGKLCLAGSDCQSGFCNAQTKMCVADQCHDGVKDGAETDIDCGGACHKCADGKMCGVAGDCASAGAICDPAGVCCVPQSTAMLCGTNNCGSLINNCMQTVVCGNNGGACASAAQACVNNRCCDTMDTVCNGRCGMVTNACGQTFDCGGCAAGSHCDSGLHSCCTDPSTACGAQPCGTIMNSCGQTVQCGNAGACADSTNYTCMSDACCKTAAFACSGVPACHNVDDGCGNSYTCGSCSGVQVCNPATLSCCTPTACTGCGAGYTDGCGNTCGCPGSQICNSAHACVCPAVPCAHCTVGNCCIGSDCTCQSCI